MRIHAAVLVLAALACPALGQGLPTLHIEADTTTASIGDTITWTVRASGVTSQNFVQAYDLTFLASAQIAEASAFQTGLSALVGPTAGAPAAGRVT